MRYNVAVKLDGKHVANVIKQDLIQRVELLKQQGVTPGLGTLMVGDDPGSQRYVAGKHQDCAQVGIRSLRKDLPADASMWQVQDAVQELNEDPHCTGFIVQLPLPDHIDQSAILGQVDPRKDADGLHPVNLGRLVCETRIQPDMLLPCTPRGILELLSYYHYDLAGKHVCIVGRGLTVGKPLSLLLSCRPVNATVTMCHSRTTDLSEQLKKADVIVAATGNAHMITSEDVTEHTVLVDVGVSRYFDEEQGRFRIAGDVSPTAYGVVQAYTPNPGGVGPMTRAMLLSNVVQIAEQACNITR